MKEGRRNIYVKSPCTSLKAAQEYKKVLQKWWGDDYKTTIDEDFATNYDVAKKLQEMPF